MATRGKGLPFQKWDILPLSVCAHASLLLAGTLGHMPLMKLECSAMVHIISTLSMGIQERQGGGVGG